MRANIKSTLLALAIIVPASGAWTVANEMLVLQPQSRLWIDGTSSIRSFSCKASEVNAVVEASGPNDIPRGADGIAGTINGTLVLGGVTKPVAIKAEGKPENGMLHITGSYDLNM